MSQPRGKMTISWSGWCDPPVAQGSDGVAEPVHLIGLMGGEEHRGTGFNENPLQQPDQVAARIAILPTGLCYPGVDKNGGDRPPCPICAPTWHPRVLPHLAMIGLTLLIGSYAQAHYLGEARGGSMHETVMRWRDYLPRFLPLPHPSWRNTAWLRRNPWFENELLPELRARVHALID